MGRRISKEFLHPSILEGVNNKIGNLDSLETDAKGNMVQAINELVEKLDNSAEIENGKELIANAVGEPLTAEDSFDEMSNDINGLLSTFKTNMMNNGITVESGDRFKSLIDKIATMVEEGSGKGIRFIQGSIQTIDLEGEGYYAVVENIPFKPDIIVIHDGDYHVLYDRFTSDNNYYIFSYMSGDCYNGFFNNSTDFVTDSSFSLATFSSSGGVATYYVIGVGEEDTTLRDSLASILQEEGVSVTEEDDMASLISKVDSELAKLPSNNAEIQVYSVSGMIDVGYSVVGGGNGFKPTYNGTLSYHIENPSSSYKISAAIDIIHSDTGETERVIEDTVDATEIKIGKLSFKANDTIKVLAKCSNAAITVNAKFLLNVLILD